MLHLGHSSEGQVDDYIPTYISVYIYWYTYHGRHICHISIRCVQLYDDVIMGAMASQITSLPIVYSTVYSDADQRKHQSSASLAFVREIHRRRLNFPHNWPVTRKMFPFHDRHHKYTIINHFDRGYRLSFWLCKKCISCWWAIHSNLPPFSSDLNIKASPETSCICLFFRWVIRHTVPGIKDPFYMRRLTLITAWMKIYMSNNIWD